jgi:glucose-6-phosphate 1-dehydrogenase
VPFYLRTGKAMAATRRTITLGFKEPIQDMFGHPSPNEARTPRPNELTFELSDPGVIWIDFLAKEPGTTTALGPASLTFRYGESFDVGNDLEAYERLLHDAMLGDHTLFTRADGIERLWEISAPLLELPPKPAPYPPGSWGPPASEQLVVPHRWHLPYPTRRQQ